MSLIIGIKVFSDLCLYFSFAGSIFAKPCQGMVPAWSILLCAAGAALGAALESRRAGARLVGLLLPVSALLTASTLPHVLLLLPALAYTGALIVSGRFHLDHGRCCEVFPRQLIALCFLLFMALLAMVDRRCALLYGGLHLLADFFLLRQLRLHRCSNWQNRSLNLLALLAAVGGGGALCLAIWGLFHLPISFNWLLAAAFYLLVVVVQILFWAFRWLFRWLSTLLGNATDNMEPPELVIADPLFEAGEIQQNLLATRILTALIVLIVTIIVLIVIRRILGNLRSQPEQLRDTPVTERLDPQKKEKKAPLRGSNRDKLRRCYRSFLKHLYKHGLEADPSLTTEEIHRKARALTDPASAEALRGLYLPARYDDGAEITAQQVRDAKTILKNLRKDSEL